MTRKLGGLLDKERKRRNFRTPLQLERWLFKIMCEVEAGERSANEARACSQLANSWLKTHEARMLTEFDTRLKMLEEAAGTYHPRTPKKYQKQNQEQDNV